MTGPRLTSGERNSMVLEAVRVQHGVGSYGCGTTAGGVNVTGNRRFFSEDGTWGDHDPGFRMDFDIDPDVAMRLAKNTAVRFPEVLDRVRSDWDLEMRRDVEDGWECEQPEIEAAA